MSADYFPLIKLLFLYGSAATCIYRNQRRCLFQMGTQQGALILLQIQKHTESLGSQSLVGVFLI